MEKNFSSILEEEEKINEILENVTLKKPSNIFHIYIREEIKKDKGNDSIDKEENETDPINTIDIKKYKTQWNLLTGAEKNEYKKIYDKEYKNYLKEIEVVKKYLFKGLDGKILFKQTAYHYFLNQQLIKGLDKGEDPQIIMRESKISWKKLSLKEKQKFVKRDKNNKNLIQLIIKYNEINPIIIFCFIELENSLKANKKIGGINDVLTKWKNLEANQKKLYEKYTRALIIIKYKLLNIYYIINGIKPKAPSGALKLFLEIKIKENAISSIKKGIDEWEKLEEMDKQYYLKLSHSQFLAYKYEEMIHNYKINKNIPKKPNLFNIYLKAKKGIKLDKGVNPITYWRRQFDSLNPIDKKIYEDKYNKSLEKYNKKLDEYNNKIMDIPKAPKTPFSFYFENRLINISSENIDIKNLLDLTAKEWQSKTAKEKEKYIKLADEDKARFKRQISEFQKHGFYLKKEPTEASEDQKHKVTKKRSEIIANKAKKRNKSRNKKVKLNYGSPSPKRHN